MRTPPSPRPRALPTSLLPTRVYWLRVLYSLGALAFLLLGSPPPARADLATVTRVVMAGVDVDHVASGTTYFLDSPLKPGHGRLLTSGSSTTVTAATAADVPFLGVAVGDVLVFQDGSIRYVTARASSTSITVSSAITLTPSQSFQYRTLSSGVASTSGWFSTAGLGVKTFTFKLDQVNATGGVAFTLECEAGGVAGAVGSTYTYTTTATNDAVTIWDVCDRMRVGANVVTSDDGADTGGDAERANASMSASVGAVTEITTGGGPGGGGGFDELTSGTNTSAAMVVGTGGSLAASGSGTIAATTSAALAADPANCAAGQVAVGVDASGVATCTATPTVTSITGALTGNASTASALAADPADCSAGQVATGIAASGALSCTATPTVTSVTGALVGNASTATALAANGANCSAGSYARGVDASGAAENCTAITAGTFDTIGSGTNTTAAMVVGNGATLAATGTGTITATAAPVAGISGLGTGVGTFLATPSGANLATALTTALPVSKGGTNATSASITAFNNITGFSAAGSTGTTSTNLVFSTSPALTTPTLGVFAATNGSTITQGSGSGTAKIGGTLCSSSPSGGTPTTGTPEEVLWTCAIPASFFTTTGIGVHCKAHVQHAANTNGTSVRMRAGATGSGTGGTQLITTESNATSGGVQWAEVWIKRTGSNTQMYAGDGKAISTAIVETAGTLALTEASASEVVLTAANPTAAGDSIFIAGDCQTINN